MDDIQLSLVAGATTRDFLSSGDSFLPRYKGLLVALAQADDDPKTLLTNAASVTAENRRLPPNLMAGLSRAFAHTEQAFSVKLDADFTGLVDRHAGQAIEALGLVARDWAPPLGRSLNPLDLSTPPVQRTVNSLVMSLLMYAPKSSLNFVIEDPVFGRLIGENVGRSLGELVNTWAGPDREFIASLVDVAISGSGNTADRIKTYVQDGVSQTIGEATERFAIAAAEIRRNGPAIGTQVDNLRTVAGKLDAIGSIGSFVIGRVLSDPEAARRFSAGMQVAGIALQVGLLVSTGGMGALAGAATVLSGLQGMQDVFGGGNQDSTTQMMVQQLGRQIEGLRQEMHERFSRVERLQGQALALLAEVATELQNNTLAARRHFEEIRTDVARLDQYVRATALQNELQDFNSKIAQVRVIKSSSTATDVIAIEQSMMWFLGYADFHATGPAFVYDRSASLRDAVEKSGRIDLSFALLSKATERLGLGRTASFVRNPVEWSRGVQAYIETQALFPEIRNFAVRTRATQVWNAGLEIWQATQTICTTDNIIKAKAALDRTRPELFNAVLASIGSIPGLGRPPVLGTLPIATLSDPIPADQQSGNSTAFVVEAKGAVADWKIQYGDDRTARAIQIGRVELVGGEENYYINGGVFGPVALTAAHYKKYKIMKGPTELGDYYEYTVPVYGPPQTSSVPGFGMMTTRLSTRSFKAIGFGSKTPREMLDQISVELDDRQRTIKWLERLSDETSRLNADEAFETIAAYCLFAALLDWCSTERADDPAHNQVTAVLPRSDRDVAAILIEFVDGIRPEQLHLIEPDAQEGRDRNEYNLIKDRLKYREVGKLVA